MTGRPVPRQRRSSTTGTAYLSQRAGRTCWRRSSSCHVPGLVNDPRAGAAAGVGAGGEWNRIIESGRGDLGDHIAAADGDIGHVEGLPAGRCSALDFATWPWTRAPGAPARGRRVARIGSTSVDLERVRAARRSTREEIKYSRKHDPSGFWWNATTRCAPDLDHHGWLGHWKTWWDEAI